MTSEKCWIAATGQHPAPNSSLVKTVWPFGTVHTGVALHLIATQIFAGRFIAIYIEIDVPTYPIGISCKGVYYYRSGSTKQVLTGPALEAFLMRKRGATWDNLPLPAFSLDDVDDNIVEHFKQWASKRGRIDSSVLNEPKDALMEKLHLTNGAYLTNAAMLLFSKDPERWQLGAYVKIGYFENDADLLYQDEVHVSILEQIDKIAACRQSPHSQCFRTHYGDFVYRL